MSHRYDLSVIGHEHGCVGHSHGVYLLFSFGEFLDGGCTTVQSQNVTGVQRDHRRWDLLKEGLDFCFLALLVGLVRIGFKRIEVGFSRAFADEG